MGLLKQKVLRAFQNRNSFPDHKPSSPKIESEEEPSSSHSQESQEMHTRSYHSGLSEDQLDKTRKVKVRKSSPGNNIMKNYCRGLVNFALSPLADPYLADKAQEGNALSGQRFRQILKIKKKNINCIKSLRSLLLKENRDSREMKAFKPMFQYVCEVFLKYFCVNWVFHSKVEDKVKHLKYRGKILRRIQNPELFTYLEEFKKDKTTDSEQF